MSLCPKNTAIDAAVAAAATAGTAIYIKGPFNATAVGNTFTGTFHIERSFDDGVTWAPISKDLSGTANTFTGSMSLSLTEYEDGVKYRFFMDTRSAGSVAFRLSQNING